MCFSQCILTSGRRLEGIYVSSGRTVKKTISEFLPSPLEPLGFQMERKCSLLSSLVRAVFSVGIPSACDVCAQVYWQRMVPATQRNLH